MKLLLFLLFTLNLYSFPVLKLENNNYTFTTENILFKNYTLKITSYFKKSSLKYFDGADGVKIAYKTFKVKNSKGTIVIVSGRTESMIKYQELIYDLSENGFNVFIYDHRGQGLSGRTQNIDSQLGDVEYFNNYVKDLKYFVEHIVKKQIKKKPFLLSHSMGGAISSLYLEKYGDDFKAAVMSSPMHQPSIGGTLTTDLVCSFYVKERQGRVAYVIGTSSYDDAFDELDYKIYTQSIRRYALVVDAYEKYPLAKIGGPSSRWLAQACQYSKLSISNAYKIKTPILLLSAGEDKIVNEKAQQEFCDNVGSLCQAYSVENSEHEIFIQRDSIRNRALVKILNFFKANN